MDFLTQWRNYERVNAVSVVTIVGLVFLYVVVSVVASQLFVQTGFVQFDPAVGLVVPFSVVFGVLGIAGAVFGLVVRDVAHGAVGVSTGLVALAHVFGGYLAYRVGPRLGILSAGRTPREWVRWFIYVCFLALVVAAAIAATLGWGNELLARSPFYLASFTAFQYFVATVVLGVPLLGLVTMSFREWAVPQSTTDESGLTHFVPLVAAVSFGWFALGTAGSIGFRILAEFPAAALRGAGLGFLVTLSDPGLFGRGAIRLLTILTVVAIALLVLLVVADRREMEVAQ